MPQAKPSQAVASYIAFLENDLAPRARGPFRLGRERLQQKLLLDEGITLSPERLSRSPSGSCTPPRTNSTAWRRGSTRGTPSARGPGPRPSIPPRARSSPPLRRSSTSSPTFIRRHDLVSLPGSSDVRVAPTPRFYRWTFASMWTPGPFETRNLRGYYYITDVDPSWPAERQEEHLRDLSIGALWSISIHEVFPGHFLHYQHLRQISSTLRKSILFSSTAMVEGWAHYTEQMMVEAGFRRDDPRVKLGQLAEALIRLCRVIVGIRLHCEDLSVEQGVRIFRDEAYLEEAAARREAERGTFDPSYVLYSLGKLMVLKLREDYRSQTGDNPLLAQFHDRLLANGTVPLWLHRNLLLGENNGDMLE